MNLEEAKKVALENSEINFQQPNFRKYIARGFLEGYKQCLEKMDPIVNFIEEISWGISESQEDANGIKFVRVRDKLEIQWFANEALKLFDEIKREVEGK